MVKRYKCLKGLPCDRHISSKNYYRLSLKAHRMPERCLTHWCSEKVNCQPYITGLSSLDIVLIFVVVRCSVTQSYPTLCNPVDWSKPGFPVVHHLPVWALSSSNSCPLSQWCHPTISSSVAPFSSCPQSFPVSESFPMSQVFAPGGQSIKYWYFLYYSSHHEKLNSNQQHTSNKQSRELKESCHMVTVTKTVFRRSEATRLIELRWSRKALLVVQWWRIHLAVRGISVQPLVQEDPKCHGAPEPVRHDYWACAPQEEKPLQWEAHALQRRVAPTCRN